MKERKKALQKRIIGAVVVAIVALSFVGLIFGRKNTPFEQVLKETFQSIEYYCVKQPLLFFSNLKDEYFSMRNVYEENERLRSALDDYATLSAQNEALKKENEDLKAINGLENIPTDFKEKTATVISRDVESWNNKLMINVGSQDGVQEGMIVLGNGGMVGKITSVNVMTSTVSLLTSENSSTEIPVMVKKKGTENEYAYGMLKSYDVEKKCFVIDMVEDVEVEVGAEILTSGLGGISPRGILVGYIQSYSVPENQILPKLYAEPSSHFDDLNYVVVLQRSDVSE